MLIYTLRRLASAVPTLFVIVTVAFFLVRFAPGGPFDMEQPVAPQVLENLKRAYRLDQPLFYQYLDYLGKLVRGDLGPSYSALDFTVGEMLMRGLPYSISLGFGALVLAVFGGVTAGVVAALHQNSASDYSVMTVATVGVTVPNFVVGPLLQLVFGLMLGLLPLGGWGGGDLSHRILPTIALALPQMAVIARLTRGAMIEALRADHIRTLRANGLSNSIIITHALRGALLPVISYLGPAAAALVTGSVVIEKIFAIPGVGAYFVDGALNRDYTLVMGTVVMLAGFVVIFNLIVDLLYAALDPRVRYE
ncbi:ABC transporter permease [Chelatococcus asaccharovorans]|uniref:ABC transporter permease n=1 Tax=Chelatococcus asaccharovorans TaxID=28210 RepID=UPI00224C6E87|nr:ABC transporter permease subunit [Chelatococcus asaccharovorans]CAH1665396.1 murein tripeptide ABC transporter/oligopeptide ABC transporter inner membrane subunit OppB [Chelatococcus asaccharovorans]CAH1681977.1 murein tripeptide ABC transporter/oligopeptide ABC transporter inner membrane subunit OppB [Chelatococcus asaccharovorans]